MKTQKNRLETPLAAYVVITISFVIGIVAANASGQTPQLVGNARGSSQDQRMLTTKHDQDHVHRRWILGVRADATESGYLIRHVEPDGAAVRVGLEPGDRLVAIDGIQIGFIGHRSVPLSETLRRRAGLDGHVQILVQNHRNGRLVSLKVTLRHPSQHLGHGACRGK